MKLRCQRDGLLMACQMVGVAVADRTSPRQILTNIKAGAEGDRLTLMATDLEVGIRYELRGLQVEEAGDAIFPVGRLVPILRESPDEEVHIEADATHSLITTSTSEFEMPGEDPEDFPDFPEFENQSYHELTAGVLRSMIRQTIFAASKEESHKYAAITGVLWELEEKKVRLVTTDTRRLAVAEGPAEVHGEGDAKGQSYVILKKAMELLERNQHDDDELIRVSLRANDVLFQTEKATIYGRLGEGRFPPYRDIIPKKSNARIALPVEPFLSAIRQAAIMTDEESKRVVFRFAPGKLTLEAQGATTGRSKVSMPIQFEGPAIDINFNTQYLVEMLRVLEDRAEVTLDLVDGAKPALFRAGEEYVYLVMPLA